MEKVSFGRVNNRRLEDNFITALKNPNFVKVVNTLDTKDEIKYRYTSQLMEIANNLDICANCKGLSKCPYEIKGLYNEVKSHNVSILLDSPLTNDDKIYYDNG